MLTLGERILQRRRELRLSQGELAARVGCPTAVISNVERDKQDVFSKRLALLATALEVSTDYLLGLTDAPEPAPRPCRRAPEPGGARRRTASASVRVPAPQRQVTPAPLSEAEQQPLEA